MSALTLNASTDSYDSVLSRWASARYWDDVIHDSQLWWVLLGLRFGLSPHLPIQILAEPYHERRQFLHILKRGSEIHNAGP
jgi:hypothetical protein